VMVVVCQEVELVGLGLVIGAVVVLEVPVGESVVELDFGVGGTTVTVIDVMNVIVVVKPMVLTVIVVVIGTIDKDVVGTKDVMDVGVGTIALVAGTDEFCPIEDVVMDVGVD
jgi:hypothetical protein